MAVLAVLPHYYTNLHGGLGIILFGIVGVSGLIFFGGYNGLIKKGRK
jgi:hypothetical protein